MYSPNSLVNKLLRLIAISLLIVSFSTAMAYAAEEGSKEALVNPEHLSGGIIHNEGFYIPRGLMVQGSLLTPVDTRVNKIGDLVTLQTTVDLLISDYNIIPANSFLHGYISSLKKPGRVYKNAEMEITFDKATIATEAGRKELFIQGKVNVKEFQGKAKAVSDGAGYGSSSKKSGLVGGLIGGVSAMASFGGVFERMMMLGGFGVGAVAGAALAVKDDLRVETGTDLVVMIDKPTMYAPVDHMPGLANYKPHSGKPQTAAEAYDHMHSTMQAQLL